MLLELQIVYACQDLRSNDLVRPEEPVVQEVRRMIVAEPRESNTTTINIQGDVTISNAIQEIDSKYIPEQSKRRLIQILILLEITILSFYLLY